MQAALAAVGDAFGLQATGQQRVRKPMLGVLWDVLRATLKGRLLFRYRENKGGINMRSQPATLGERNGLGRGGYHGWV